METFESRQPKDLDNAIEIMKDIMKDELHLLSKWTEKEFIGKAHHGFGTNVRNEWNLWWHENPNIKGWPKEKPKLTEFFNNLGIYHGDDLSGIILTSFYRSVTGKDVDLEGQVNHYKNFWLAEGFKDGIYDYNRKSDD